MGEKIALGRALPKSAVGVVAEAKSLEERLALMESKLKAMTHAFYSIKQVLSDKPDTGDAYQDQVFDGVPTNRDGIPIGTVLMGMTVTAPFICTVGVDGRYYVNDFPYDSLSSAAAAVGAPQRKSGWRFWKMLDGRPVKEVFKRTHNV